MLGSINREMILRLFWLMFVMTLMMVVVMQVTNAPLKTTEAPAGIISFEFAGTLESSRSIVQSWQGEIMPWAGLNMGLDFLFLILYGTTIAMACLLLADRIIHPLWTKVGIWLAYGILFAALLDIVENIALIKLLTGSESAGLPLLAKWMAIPKFILVLLSLLYVIVGVTPALKKS